MLRFQSKIFFFLCLVINISFCDAQELPPVLKYTPDIYAADNQNWSITQTADKIMFFANNNGLLKFDGEKWKLLGSPNNTILRSVFAVGNVVYSGAYMEFGVWKKNESGYFKYHSLSKDLKLIEDEQFWNILSLDHYIVFQSLDSIYLYDSKSENIEIITSKFGITKMVILDNILYYHKKNEGLFKQINGKEVAVNTSLMMKKSILINVYTLNNQLYAQTQYNGIISVDDDSTYQPENYTEKWDNISVYNSLQLQNGDIYLGTISHGLLKLSQNRIDFKLNQDNALSNNTVLSLFQDKDGYIWLGLDNGINCVNINSNISIFNDDNGRLGTIYCTINFNNTIYLGTNQGLFYLDQDNQDFQMVKGTKGQVWSLFSHQDTLFCGHHNGTYVIENHKAELVSDVQGSWMFRSIDSKTIISGNYDGLNVLKNENGKWKYDRKIKGFDISTKYFEFIDSQNILVNHEYKGVFKLSLNDSLTKVVSVTKDTSVDKGLYSSIIKFQDKILYAYKDGVFYYDKKTSSFKKDSVLSKIYNQENYTSGRIVKTKDNKIWLFSKTDISYIAPSSVEGEYIINKIPLSVHVRNQISGYDNVSFLGSNNYMLGRSNGYFKLNTIDFSNLTPEISLNDIVVKNKKNEILSINSKSKNHSFKNSFNNFTFEISSFDYDPILKSEYQYKLEGYNSEWSSWQESGLFNFKNLSYGDYTFKVRSRIGKDNISEPIAYNFNIEKPFYLSDMLILIYVILLILIIIGVHFMYKQHYKKQKLSLQEKADRKLELKELESQKKIMRINNDKLKHDVENKNRELAIATMGLLKKNEFLSKIKAELKSLKTKTNQTSKIIKTIDNSLNNSDDWKFFEEAFNNADKDFFKKLKDKHPALTPNDLKLCAYLRLNLSSKEIAPLFNISTKSIEIKRYRLRKKMNLSRNKSLTNYILSL